MPAPHPLSLPRYPMKFLLLLPSLLLPISAGWGVAPLAAQSLDLAVGETGIRIGHAPRVNGLRINWSDRELDLVNGVNLTLWRPSSERVGGQVNGVALGVVLPQAGTIRGLGMGVGAAVAEDSWSGVGVGGGAGDDSWGVHAGGLALVTGGSRQGMGVAGRR